MKSSQAPNSNVDSRLLRDKKGTLKNQTGMMLTASKTEQISRISGSLLELIYGDWFSTALTIFSGFMRYPATR